MRTSLLLRHAVFRIDHGLDAVWKLWRRARGPLRSAQLVPYRSYGTREQLVVRGRVLTNRPLRPSATDSQWRNALHMLQRWMSREIPGATVEAEWASQKFTATTDEEGYFRIEIPTGGQLPANASWHDVPLQLPAFPQPPTAPAAVAKVLVPLPEAQFGIISDIDDTVIFTAATNYLRMAKIVLLGSAYSRLPFKGVAAFYRGLEKGTAGAPVNPFFYVSSSPWNLYDVLRDLFDYRSIPAGPLLLQDFGIDAAKFIHQSHHEHKLASIRDVMERYPRLRFLLIGDSGQEDPEIYREVVRRYPERILAVYIRDVSHSPKRLVSVSRLAAELERAQCRLLLVEETEAAAEDALRHGWLAPGVLEEIRAEKASEPPAEPVEKALHQQT
jgi:phosphatidate phosphatase APP1